MRAKSDSRLFGDFRDLLGGEMDTFETPFETAVTLIRDYCKTIGVLLVNYAKYWKSMVRLV